MKQIDKLQIKFAGGATPAVIKIARHNLLHATYFTLVWSCYWTSDREKRESFHGLTRSNNVIIWHVYCPPTQTPTLVTMGLIMRLTMIVIRIVTQTRDCKWYRRHRGDNQPPPAGAPIILCHVLMSGSANILRQLAVQCALDLFYFKRRQDKKFYRLLHWASYDHLTKIWETLLTLAHLRHPNLSPKSPKSNTTWVLGLMIQECPMSQVLSLYFMTEIWWTLLFQDLPISPRLV